MSTPTSEPSWNDYYQKVAQRPPRDLLIEAAELFPAPGFAIDLGCGSGIETRELLRRGWRVLAIDQEAAAFAHVAAGVPLADRSRLTTQCVSFTDLTLPGADFIWAGLSLPFCPPHAFGRLWEQILAALAPNGRFAGDLFGVRNAWRSNPDLTFVTTEQLHTYLQACAIERLTEREEERTTAFQGMQHWHEFAIIARKLPAT